MYKYSFIVPVYNTEKYLDKCLSSLVNQTYRNYEIVIVNDGSTDNSCKIIDSYMKKHKNIVLVEQKNQGLSMARNNGVAKASGDYLLFIDSDDYVEEELLENVDKEINGVQILRYQIITEDEDGNNLKEYVEEKFNTINGNKAFKIISSFHFVEPAWCYIYEKEYYLKNNYSFKKDIYHEDYGLIPYVIYNAKKVKGISYLGYHYITRSGSIMNNSDYKKTVKKCFDMLEGYKYLRSLDNIDYNKNNIDNYYLSYISNCAIVKARELKKEDRKKYIDELKKLKVYDGVLVNSFARKIKKKLMKINLNIYLKVIK